MELTRINDCKSGKFLSDKTFVCNSIQNFYRAEQKKESKMRKIIFFLMFMFAFSAVAESQMYYNIVLFSPVENSVHYLGESISFRAEVMEGSEKVSGANVAAILPNTVLTLSESGGAYSGNYTLKRDDNPGKWEIRLKAEKGAYKGERNLSITVNPVKLNMQILSPSKYIIDTDDVEIKINISYPEGAPFMGNASATTPYGEGALQYRNGLFYYKFPSKDGFWTMKVSASDGKNSGYAETAFMISRKSVFDAVKEYWYIIAVPLISVFLVLFFIKFPDMLLTRLKKREEKVRELMVGLQEKYFREKTMGWKNFSELETKYKAEHENIKSEIAELEKNDRRLRGFLYRKMQEWRGKGQYAAPAEDKKDKPKADKKSGQKADEKNKKDKKESRYVSNPIQKKEWEDTALGDEEK